jgi:hypothetical protein
LSSGANDVSICKSLHGRALEEPDAEMAEQMPDSAGEDKNGKEFVVAGPLLKAKIARPLQRPGEDCAAQKLATLS